jgi:carboxypeptidase C (cathepsin A)
MFRILLLLTAISSVWGQFLSSPTDLKTAKGYAGINVRYKQVPTGICELDPKVKSYSGYSDISEHEHIFWWFFETRNGDPTKAPLTVWINGGPGSSSMIGLWQENGPCFVNSEGEVYNNPYSWNNVSNMLYIDHPAQVGFSYSDPIPGYYDPDSGQVHPLKGNKCPSSAPADSCGTFSLPNTNYTANSTANAAPSFWKTLQGFMGAFPQYSRNGFHFTTESYGGHYAPVFSEYIEEQNAKHAGHEIHLESVMIGNGWYDPLIQYQAYYNFTVYPGNTYDYRPFNKSVEKTMYNALYSKGGCVDQITKCYEVGSNDICSTADNYCANNVEAVLDNIPNRDEYDIRELSPDPFPPEFYVAYLNTPKVQKAIGAFVNFTEYAYAVGVAFGSTGDDGRSAHTITDMQKLINDGITAVMYTGDADYNCNWLGGEAVSHEIDGQMKSISYANISTSDHIVHGQVKQHENFAFVRIYESGHEVPFYQPVVALELLERVINGLDVETGKVHVKKGSKYETHGSSAKSTYREGNATVQFEVVPVNATYNTTTNRPNPWKHSAKKHKRSYLSL